MEDKQNPKPVPRRSPERLAREAEALRANLRRRKDQARQRERAQAEPSDQAPQPPNE